MRAFILIIVIHFLTLLASESSAQTIGTVKYTTGTKLLEVYTKSFGWKTIGAGASLGTCTATEAGTFNYDPTAQVYRYCNATNWISFSVVATSVACTQAGVLNYDGEYNLRFCNGTVWVNATTSTHGYFVMTSSGFNGNLGNLSGADATCFNNLTNNNWIGKTDAQTRGIFTAAKVKAWLCNASTCQNGSANATYALARSGSTTAGSLKITTDASGIGPNSTARWDGTSGFNSTASYWTGRNSVTGVANVWPNTNAENCTNWSETTTTGAYGLPDFTNANRWYSTGMACSTTNRLICFVHP